MLTEMDQDRFYDEVICDPLSPHRYWSIRQEGMLNAKMVAFGGLTYINYANGHAEISLIVNPEMEGQGYGGAAVAHLLSEAFDQMRLLTVFGEVYHVNLDAVGFWTKMLEAWDGDTGSVIIPGRKFWAGEIHSATLFWFHAQP
jgi:RimJ/RimL family protein N-acetyltransferase